MQRTFDYKLADFEQAVREQLFDAADDLLQRDPPRNLAALRLLLGYFEPIAKYADGYDRAGSSKRYFVRGCRDVIERRPQRPRAPAISNKQLEGFYELARCGLAHGATLTFNVALSASQYGLAISTDGGKISVNPTELLRVLRGDLDKYLEKLRDVSEAQLRSNFEKRWDFEAGHSTT